MGQIKNAKSAFKDAINIDPMNIKARIAYAITLTKELEYAQSIEQFLEVLKYIPDNSDTLYNTALAYELTGDTERAIKYYKMAIDYTPNHKEANHNLELILGEPYIPQNVSNPETVEENKEEVFGDSQNDNEAESQELQNNTQEQTDFSDFDFDIPQDGDNQESMFS